MPNQDLPEEIFKKGPNDEKIYEIETMPKVPKRWKPRPPEVKAPKPEVAKPLREKVIKPLETPEAPKEVLDFSKKPELEKELEPEKEKETLPIKLPKKNLSKTIRLVIFVVFVIIGGIFIYFNLAYKIKNLSWLAEQVKPASLETMQNDIKNVNSDLASLKGEIKGFAASQELNKLIKRVEGLEGIAKAKDSDGDGLSDYDEIITYETDLNNSDTDGDGYLDGIEVTNGYNPKGIGRLSEKKEKDYSVIANDWTGKMAGKIVPKETPLTLNLQSDGKVTGEFKYTYKNNEINNKISGDVSFDETNRTLTADLTVEAVKGSEKAQYKIGLRGDFNKEFNSITGTWKTEIDASLSWLSGDEGDFELTRNIEKTTESFSYILGEWTGNLSGELFSSSDVSVTTREKGLILGGFVYNKDIENKMTGNYSFDSKSLVFKADLTVIAINKEKETAEYQLKFNGSLNEAHNEVIGTWTSEPKTDVDWIYKDKGNFKLIKP